MRSTRRRGVLSVLAVTTATAGLALTQIPTSTAAPRAAADPAQAAHPRPGEFAHTTKERAVNYDARVGTDRAQALAAAAIVAKRGPQFAAFAKSLGTHRAVDFDTLTGTPRNVGSLDGYMTGPSSASAESVALDYVRAHLSVLGLTESDLGTLHLRQDYVDIAGIHHLSWTQQVDGITVFGNGLKANVSKDGRLISLQGSPVSGLASKAAGTSTSPLLSAAQARAKAAGDVGGTVAASTVTATGHVTKWSNNDQAQLVWFLTSTGLQLGWSTYVQAGGTLNYQHVIDAQTGRVLYRHDTTNFDAGDARVFTNYPGAAVGGTQRVVNLYKAGYLVPSQKTWLKGQYVIAWSDVNDNNKADPNELTPVPGVNGGGPAWKFVPFKPLPNLCSPEFRCSWVPREAYSWRVNRKMDVTQGFYYASMYHDYLSEGALRLHVRPRATSRPGR